MFAFVNSHASRMDPELFEACEKFFHFVQFNLRLILAFPLN
jgi:hypothetical protein